MGPRRRSACFSLLALALLCCIVVTSAQSRKFNITRMLAGHPRFSQLNRMLTTHGLAKEINDNRRVTLFAPSNSVMRPFATSHANTDAVKITDLLRFHVILTYYDMPALRNLKSLNYTQVTTLLQNTGRAQGRDGFVNIYNLKSRNTVKIGPTSSNSSANVTVLGGVQRQPFEVSIVEIDQVLLPVGFNNATGDLIAVLDSFQEFTLLIDYILETNVSSIFAERQSSSEGITIFAPKDSAFNSLSTGSIQSLTFAEQKLLLLYHALGSYQSLDSLETMLNKPTNTLASEQAVGYTLNVTGGLTGNSTVKLRTGISTAVILEVIYDAKPVTVYAIDHVLLPHELFTLPPAPAPAPPPPPKKSPAKPAPGTKTPATDPADSATLAEMSVALTLAALFSYLLVSL